MAIMPPAGWESARRNAEITAQLQAWATRDGTGHRGGFLGRLHASERGGSFAGRFLGEQRSPLAWLSSRKSSARAFYRCVPIS